MTEEEKLARAERLLVAIREALPHVDEIYETVNNWVAGEDPPPLLKQNSSWREAVDPTTLEQFRTLTAFLTQALFGVDCDNDRAVQFAFVDRSREENFLPHWRIPLVDDVDGDLDKRYRQWELAQNIVDQAKSRADSMKRMLDEDIKKIVQRESRLQRAQDCEECKERGWKDVDPDVWFALDYGMKCRTAQIGCNFRLKEPTPGAKYRVFCYCQEDSDAA